MFRNCNLLFAETLWAELESRTSTPAWESEYNLCAPGVLEKNKAQTEQTSFTFLRGRLCFSTLSHFDACTIWDEDTTLIVPLSELLERGQLTLVSIQHCAAQLHEIILQNPSKCLVLCAAPADRATLDCIIFVGCYCIQMLGWSPRRLCQTLRSSFSSKTAQDHPRPLTLLPQPPRSFSGLLSEVAPSSSTKTRVLDVWQAYHRALRLGWTAYNAATLPLPSSTHFTMPPTQRNTMLPPPLRFVVPAELAIFGQHADADADADAAALGARA